MTRPVEIPVSPGRIALVDPADAELVSGLRWYAVPSKTGNYYAHGVRAVGYMHRLIAAAPAGVSVDHKNGNGLDNRRENLRVAGQSNNMAAANTKRGISGYRGVHKYDDSDNWRVQIKVRGVKKHVGVYPTAEDAARAYDQAAREAFGEYASLNFPEA